MPSKIMELLEKLSGKIAEVYDVELALEITKIYEDLTSHIAEVCSDEGQIFLGRQ